MRSLNLLLAAIGLLSVSGIPACFLGIKTRAGQYMSAAILLAGSSAGLVSVIMSLAGPEAVISLRLPWFLPIGEFFIRLDALSAFFLIPVFVLPFLGALFGLGWLPYGNRDKGGRRLGVFYGFLAGGMAMVCVAGDGVLFLIAWELMAVAAYFIVTADRKNLKARKAAWIYLVAAHAGTLCLFAMFAVWHKATGAFTLLSSAVMKPELSAAVFILAALGFGFKSGMMPLHFWLPDFYTHAPAHVSGVLSGVMSKMGIYGLIRLSGLLPASESWWGISLVLIGMLTAVAGILFALGQSDMKRLLAYSSVENIGVIIIGVGVAILGRSTGRLEWVLLGLGGSLFHVWNHGLFKSLLFFNIGALEKSAGTRNVNLLGGLGKKMPFTMVLFLVGALSIGALPPFNGFASEWLVYGGLFRIMSDTSTVAIAGGAAAMLAMSGALATAVFVKLFATVYLGLPRSQLRVKTSTIKPIMSGTMAFLATACIALGAFAWKLFPFLEAAVGSWMPGESGGSKIIASLEALAPSRWIGIMALALCLLAAFLFLAFSLCVPHKKREDSGTWDCGYAEPTNRMQYTGASIASSIIRLFPVISPIRNSQPKIEGKFPKKTEFRADLPDVVMNKVVLPAKALFVRIASRFHVFQQGQLSRYLLYVFIITILLFVFGAMGGF